jgi:hypothetical protein
LLLLRWWTTLRQCAVAARLFALTAAHDDGVLLTTVQEKKNAEDKPFVCLTAAERRPTLFIWRDRVPEVMVTRQ